MYVYMYNTYEISILDESSLMIGKIYNFNAINMKSFNFDIASKEKV